METQALAKIGSWELDVVNNSLWWSQESFNIFEIDSSKFGASYEAFLELVHPEDREGVNQAYAQSLIDQKPYEIQHRLLFNDGRIKYVHEYATSYFDEQGRAVRSIGTVQDVTGQVQTQLDLRQQEKELNAIIEAIPLMLFVKDAKELRFQRFNAAGEKLLGYGREELLGKNDYDFFPKEQADFFTGLDRETLESCEKRVIRQEEINTPAGKRILHTVKTSITDEKGLPKYLLGVSEDITERKAYEEELKKAAAVIDNLAEGIMISDANNRLVSINPAFTKITGYQLEEVKGKTPNVLSSGRHDQNFYQAMWRSIDEKGGWQGEIWNRRKDEEVYPQWLSISSIKDEHGQVINYIGVFSDISIMKNNEAKLRFLAHHDALTELPNRVLMNDRLEHALSQVDRNKSIMAVFYLDLDRFKTINDSFGHPYGDLLLQIVAKRLQSVLRNQDTVSRVSGDEFVVLLENLHSEEEAGLVAQKILDELGKPVLLGEHEITVTTSIGIAIAPNDGTEAVSLLKNADTALYRAKDLGRNSYEFFSSEMSASSFETLFLLNGLRKAMGNNEFVVHYQPQVNMVSNRVLGAEALLRWQHPEMGLVPPGRFIPLAEDSGLIVQLGEWVIRQSCMQMKQWLNQGLSVEYVAVNISGRQLVDKHLVNVVKSALAESGLSGDHLELEVTETLVMKESSFLEVMNELKKLGVRLSIDDFGTGYSSLVRLKHLPIDKLKIDMSFIKGIPEDEDDANITRTIINLAESMKLNVIAEGVEHQKHVDYLVEHNCLLAQGYYYSKPVSAEDFVTWLDCQDWPVQRPQS